MNDDYGKTNRVFTFEELLRFYQDSGIDIGILDQPVNRFSNEQSTTINRSDSVTAAQREPLKDANSLSNVAPPIKKGDNRRIQPKENNTSYIPLDDQVKRARDVAMSALNLDELYSNLLAFDGCPLKSTAKNTCFADGDANSELMVISDVPEREEDLQGLPFVGQSGELLNKMLAAIGYERKDVYVANVLPWRPPGNREPMPHEIETCKPFIYRQIELASPRVIMAFGGLATSWLTNNNDSILRLRGNWMYFTTPSGKKISLMPSLHPRYLLRNPGHKKFSWQDLLNVKMKLRETNS